MSLNLTVPAPSILDREFKKPLLCGPGPTNIWPSVMEAYNKFGISPKCDEYYKVLDDIRAGIQYIFQTQSKLVLAISASAHGAMEALITNLIAPKEILLIAMRGLWDQRALEIATRFGIKTVVTQIPLTDTFTVAHLEPLLKKYRPAGLFITHGDSSTGTVQNLEGLGEICHKCGTLLIVDTVVSIIAVPFFMDKLGVDAVYTSTQKTLGGPAGISPVAFSSRAETKIMNRKHSPPFYFDIQLLAPQWNCYGDTRSYHHTMSPPLLWALRECLKVIVKITLPVSWARHAEAAAHFHKKMEEFSFQCFVPRPEDRLATVTTIKLPKGYDYDKFVSYMKENFNILIFNGIGPTAGKTLRIGFMGMNATIATADAVAEAMAKTLRTLTKSSL